MLHFGEIFSGIWIHAENDSACTDWDLQQSELYSPWRLLLNCCCITSSFYELVFASVESRKSSCRRVEMSLRTQVIFKTQSSWGKIICLRNTSAKPCFQLYSTEQRGRFLCSLNMNTLIQLTRTQLNAVKGIYMET